MNTPLEIVKLTDRELLETLCSTEDDNALYAQFLDRFLPDVEHECLRICTKRKLDPHIGQQIAHETFERVRLYKSFKTDEIKLADERKAILAYLNRISSRLFSDHHRKQKSTEVTHRTYFDDLLNEGGSQIDNISAKRKKDIAEAIYKKLTESERKVILADLEFKSHHKHLPEKVVDELIEQLGVKRDSIRKIRARGFNKIKNAINEINQG